MPVVIPLLLAGRRRRRPAPLCVLLLAAVSAYGQSAQPYPMGTLHESGQGVTGAFEGWFKNSDGSFSLLLGYFNRNTREELDIPIGPNNRIEPAGPDQGQPVHFLAGRQWGVFTVSVPKDFGTNKLTWTLTANGQTNVIPLSLNPLWEFRRSRKKGLATLRLSSASTWGVPPYKAPGRSAHRLRRVWVNLCRLRFG